MIGAGEGQEGCGAERSRERETEGVVPAGDRCEQVIPTLTLINQIKDTSTTRPTRL